MLIASNKNKTIQKQYYAKQKHKNKYRKFLKVLLCFDKATL